MPGAFARLIEHIVFSTERREHWSDADLQPRPYDYRGGITRRAGNALRDRGIPDHVHLLIRWQPEASLSDLLRKPKASSSLSMHLNFPDKNASAWQECFSAFSVSKSVEPDVKAYIENQTEHRRRRDFKEESAAILRSRGRVRRELCV